ncbi:MAG: hypothetical protein Q8Q15_01445, partial [bacterium]|nr:hypothetical protein [bacterium]
LRQKKVSSLNIIFYALPLAWVVFYISLYGFSIPLMHGGWYRVFWPFPLILGVLISFIWGDFWEVISEKLKDLKWRFVAILFAKAVFGVLILLGGFVVLSRNSAEQMLKKIEDPHYRQQSSAFPDSLSVDVDKEKFEGLKKKLVPSWLDPNDTQYRFYDADQRVNIWWNTFYDMPLVKGYIEFPPGDSAMGSYYWLSTGLTSDGGKKDVLVEQWGVPEETAYNNVLFLLDWFSIKYLEAEHDKSDSYNPLTSYIQNSDIFSEKEKVIVPGWVEIYVKTYNNIGPIVWHPEAEESLSYYKIKDELVTPIIYPSNASTLGIIGRQDAYSTIIRNLGALNLNSRHVVPIWLGPLIDDVSSEDLKAMDALFLYTYDYKNYGNSWSKIEKYIKDGGKVFVETGSDVKQTASSNLPSIFPIKETTKKQLGSEWDLSGDSKETGDINFEKFGLPVLDKDPWLFSVPASSTSLKEGGRAILSDKNVPLVASRPYGKGLIIWSGMNLPYHLTTNKSLEELKFFKKLLDQLVETDAAEYPEFSAERISPNKVMIKSQNAKGVLFKENMNSGWGSKLSSNVNKNLKIYKTGLTYHGYAYVRLPEEVKDSFTVTFSYRGYFWSYFWSAISILTILLILDKGILGGRFLYPLLVKLLQPLRQKTARILEKDEDY